MDRRKDAAIEAILEQLIETGPGDIASVFARAFEMAMRLGRERFLGAGHYERTFEHQGYANGYRGAVPVDQSGAHGRPRMTADMRRLVTAAFLMNVASTAIWSFGGDLVSLNLGCHTG